MKRFLRKMKMKNFNLNHEKLIEIRNTADGELQSGSRINPNHNHNPLADHSFDEKINHESTTASHRKIANSSPRIGCMNHSKLESNLDGHSYEMKNNSNENSDVQSKESVQDFKPSKLETFKANNHLQGEEITPKDPNTESPHPWDRMNQTSADQLKSSNQNGEKENSHGKPSFAADPVGFLKNSSTKLFNLKSNLPTLSIQNAAITRPLKKSSLPPSNNIIVPWIEQEIEKHEEMPNDIPKNNSNEEEELSSNSSIPYLSRFWSYMSSWFSSSSPNVDSSPSFKTDPISSLKPVSKIQKIVIIGVHGWFPNKMLQRVVGEPIGTSSLFGKKMEKAVLNYFHQRKIEVDPSLLTVVPLEGGGKIFERVNNLYEQLMNNAIDQVKAADFIIFSAHSQGSPVSALILQRLIKEGIVDPARQRTAILAMAGISHGPFPSMKNSVIVQYVETEQAKELFDFNDPTSKVSDAYMMAMKDILECGCRYVAIGSWYDQVVPLYSATLQGVNHANLYRALYIDEKDYQPDFLSHLIAFALKLRNFGLSDHGLCIHLSDALAGSIYGFGTQGHSAVYEEDQTYTLGVTWALYPFHKKEASHSLIENKPALPIISHFSAPSKLNPFYLPWIWAHLSMDPVILNNPSLRSELEMIKMMFLRWAPSASHLKDIKYRLEPIKSKL